MLAVERRIKVLERLAADQAVEVSSLAREFGVSEMTIRRDLHRLDRDGFVRRTYGGATTRVVRAAGAFEVSQNARVMYIGVGSTVEQFARLTRPREDLLVITPSLVVASLLGTRRVQVIIVGGLVRQDELNCVGPSAVECAQRYNTDVAVIGAAGVSARFGVTDLDDGEAGVNRAALERTRQIVVLADGSKFGDVALSTVAPIKDVSVIVTDSTADTTELELIERVGVEVIKVHPTAEAAR